MNSLTGVSAAPAKTLQMGYEEEVEYINANGGINGGQIDSVNLDDKSDMSASVAGVTQLIHQDRSPPSSGRSRRWSPRLPLHLGEGRHAAHALPPPTLADLTNTNYKWSFLCAPGLMAAPTPCSWPLDQGYKNIVAIGDVLPIHQETLLS